MNSGSDVTITFQRDLNTPDSNDFYFDLTEYIDCFPILLTAFIGDASTISTSTSNTFASSYVYIYNTSFNTWSSSPDS